MKVISFHGIEPFMVRYQCPHFLIEMGFYYLCIAIISGGKTEYI